MNKFELEQGEAIPEAHVLIECLRGSSFPSPPSIDWQTLLDLAESHSVLPLVHQTLVATGAEVPAFFSKAVHDCQAATEMLATELEYLLASFAESHIDVAPLKGPVLAEMLYGEVALRSCTDLDLLVRASDFNRAERLLMDAGWVASSPADDYQRKFVRNGVLLELHFGLASPRAFPFDVNEIWRRMRGGIFRGQPLKAMSEIDLALYLLVHAMKHGFGKLIWVLDVARALENVRECSPREFVQQARARGLEQVLFTGCEMVREVFPQRLPEGLIVVLEESPELMRAARENVARLLIGGVGAAQNPEIWGFYLQTETKTSNRWRRRLMYLVPTAADYRWTECHRIPRGFAPLVRPFRLLAKHGLRRAWRTAFPPSA